jgi:hypothetical protein
MSDIREEIVKKAKQNQQRKKIREFREKVEIETTQKLTDKYKDYLKPDMTMPLVLFVLIVMNVLAWGVLELVSETTTTRNIVVVGILGLVGLVALNYILRVVVFVYNRAYWWVNVAIAIITLLFLIYTIFARLMVIDPV